MGLNTRTKLNNQNRVRNNNEDLCQRDSEDKCTKMTFMYYLEKQ